MPEIGFELIDEHGGLLGEAELAWPSAKIAVLSGANNVDANRFQSAGWQTVLIAEVIASPRLAELLELNIKSKT